MRQIGMMTVALAALGCVVGAGCSGQHVVSVADHVAPAGEAVPVVVRLQRSELWLLLRPVRGGAVQMRIADGPLRAAYTDDLGYAAGMVPVPADPGRYDLHVFHLNADGEEASAAAPVYVWDANRPVVAVDVAALPSAGDSGEQAAVAAVHRLAEGANVLYFTQSAVENHPGVHDRLARAGYPDGPLLLWKSQRLHLVRGDWRIPRLVVEKKMVSRLGQLRERFGGLDTGVARSAAAARSFAEAGLKVVLIGSAEAPDKSAARFASWADLAERGL